MDQLHTPSERIRIPGADFALIANAVLKVYGSRCHINPRDQRISVFPTGQPMFVVYVSEKKF